MATTEDYSAKAADALVQLEQAKSEGERVRLRRAHGAYMRLSRHGAEAAERAAAGPGPKIKSEKSMAASHPAPIPRYFSQP
ncbi:MAG TPA: hypothetical protein VF582_07220 [Allosphingosinicella sp.]|jgi:hypothetical protein